MASDYERSRAGEPNAERRHLWRLLGVAGLLAVPLVLIWWPGCRQYPAVSSKDSLYLMKLLYTACNTQDPVRLAKVERGVEKAARDDKLTPAEHDAFDRIIGMAKKGAWQEAQAAALRFAQDQVGQGGQSAPHAHDHVHEHKGKHKH